MSNLIENVNKVVDMTYKPIEETLYSGSFIKSLTQVGDNNLVKPLSSSVDYSKMDNLSETQKTLLNNISQTNTNQVNLAVADLNNMFKSTLNKISSNAQDTSIQMGMNVNQGNDLSLNQSGRNISYLQDVNTVAQNQIIEQQKSYTTEAGKILAQSQQANNQLLGQAVQLQDSNEKFKYQKEQQEKQWAFQKEQYYTSLLGSFANDKGQMYDPKTGQLTDKPVYTIQGDQYYNYNKPLQNFTLYQKAMDAKFYPTEKQLAINTQNLSNRIAATNEQIAIAGANREQVKFNNALNAQKGESGSGQPNTPTKTANDYGKVLQLDQQTTENMKDFVVNGKLDNNSLTQAFLSGDPKATAVIRELDKNLGTGRGIYYNIDIEPSGKITDPTTGNLIDDPKKPSKLILTDDKGKPFGEGEVLVQNIKEKIKVYGLNLNANAPTVGGIEGNDNQQIKNGMQQAFSSLLNDDKSLDNLNKVMISSKDNKQVVVALKNINGVNKDESGKITGFQNNASANYGYFKFDLTGGSTDQQLKLREELEKLNSGEKSAEKLNNIFEAFKKAGMLVQQYDQTGANSIDNIVKELKGDNWQTEQIFGKSDVKPYTVFSLIAAQSLTRGGAIDAANKILKYKDNNSATPDMGNADIVKELNRFNDIYPNVLKGKDTLNDLGKWLDENKKNFEGLISAYYWGDNKNGNNNLANYQSIQAILSSATKSKLNDNASYISDLTTRMVEKYYAGEKANLKLKDGDKEIDYSEWFTKNKTS
jgi:hypothetical protein